MGGTAVPTNESGPGAPDGGINRYDFDQTAPTSTPVRDYAFFASDASTLEASFKNIVNSTANGDYTTSSAVSGGAFQQGNIVILPSTKYPQWQGHLRALDTTDPAAIIEKWDAGAILSAPNAGLLPHQPTPAQRSLWTWDPSNANVLIEITDANKGKLDLLCGGCGAAPAAAAKPALTSSQYWSHVVDFIRGNDGTLTNTKRQWLLGPAINSTPALVGPPTPYFQSGNVTNHKPFEAAYRTRRPLAWVGADDGLVHAFDFVNGSEVIALLPPSLIQNQTMLYDNYTNLDPVTLKRIDTGQISETDLHIWGVASSFRFADVWFGNPTNAYKTVGFLTLGPGGNLVAAIDISHPFPGTTTPAVSADPNFDATKPVEVLWTKNETNYAGLFGSWSVPAVASTSFVLSRLTFGAGINPSSLYNGQADANVFVVDPTDGTLLSSPPVVIAPKATPTPLVGHQTFAHSVFFQTTARGFQPDNIANLSLQADTNGRVNAMWGNWASPNSAVLIDLNAAAGDVPQPIYYSPAASGVGTQGCQVYALASGSLYERSPAVSGWNVNRDAPTVKPPAGSGFPDDLPAFVPNLFIATNPYKLADSANFAVSPLGTITTTIVGTTTITRDLTSYVRTIRIGGESAGIPLELTDPTYSDGSSTPLHTRLGIHTQVTSSPLLVNDPSTDLHEAFFSVYDPDYGCNGHSYIVIVKFTLPGGCNAGPLIGTTTVASAGAGAASGFVVTKDNLFAAHSGVKENSAALVKVAVPPAALPGAPNFLPIWWKEQK
jgi:hypothetical protein